MPEIPSRLAAALADRYRIDRPLGEGGMATVYLAQDLKHDRRVAVKVLKPELAAVVGADRFLAEIRTTANLQHPNILPLFDSGEADTFLFYVMPYVEGESLRDRLDRERQLPVEEAIRIATEVGEALDHAHRQGIIHRDIKPANILLREGRPLVADFGIALAVTAAGAGRLTETGLSLGTPYYMSPEQATADRDPGPQSDVYSLGCVLYEMLAGEPPFTGSSAQAILGKIITGEAVPPSRHRATVPPHVDWVVTKAIGKLPADRFPSAAKMTQALSDPSFAPAARVTGAGGSGKGFGRIERWIWAGALTTVTVAGIFLWKGATPSGASGPEVVRLSIRLPDSIPMAFIGSATLGNGRRALAVSDDGANLVYAGLRNGVVRLYLRPMDSFEVVELPGTEGAYGPFFSPNGRWVGFFVANQLKKVRIDGGEPVVLATATNSVGADWSEDGRIVFSDGEGDGLRVVSDQAGSAVEDVGSSYPDSTDFSWPQWLPDSRRIIAGGVLLDPSSGEWTRIVGGDRHVEVLPSGYFVEMNGSGLSASRFDADQGRVTSPVVPVLSGIRGEIYGQGQWDVTPGGTLVYAEGGSLNEGPLAWVESDGTRTHLDMPVRERGSFELSPDGDRLAVIEYDPGGSHVWVYDLNSGRREQLTVEPGAGPSLDWSPDGQAILFNRFVPLRAGFIKPLGSGSDERRAFPADSIEGVYSWSPGGGLFGLAVLDPAGLGVADLASQSVTRINTDGTAWGLVLSPGGDAVAYTSALTGEYQNYVEPYPPTGERLQVSIVGGAEEPRWSDDGRRLYYRSGRRIMVVDVERSPGLSVGSPRVAYEGDFVNVGGRSFDVSPDEARFLVIDDPVVTTTTLKVVQGWTSELERLIAGAGGAGN